MSYSVCLLTAACLTAAPPDAPAPMPGATQTIPVTTPEAPPPSAPRLFDRIRGFFGGRRAEAPAATVEPTSKAPLGTAVTPSVVGGAGVPTVAPGNAPPVTSLTTPVMVPVVWADAGPASEIRREKTTAIARTIQLVFSEGLRPSDSPTPSLIRRFGGSLRSGGSLAALVRGTPSPRTATSPFVRWALA